MIPNKGRNRVLSASIRWLTVLSVLFLLQIFYNDQVQAAAQSSEVEHKAIKTVLAKHSRNLASLPGVTAVAEGECDGEPCIKIYLSRDSADVLESIPKSIEGIPISVSVSGEIKALD
ncbi:MAG: hypothetical protein IIB69_10595 [Proteobacteria bacterium]|nr:hypothetical protein [Pseudomonadota bacterium]